PRGCGETQCQPHIERQRRGVDACESGDLWRVVQTEAESPAVCCVGGLTASTFVHPPTSPTTRMAPTACSNEACVGWSCSIPPTILAPLRRRANQPTSSSCGASSIDGVTTC